ncbi:MAG: MBL fold metallo-hydrolase [Firmicutes bacterium]|nr:MBL fold metallo-hydrolase [Bacillota bacterium]
MNTYQVTLIGEGIYLIFEPAEDVCMYLVVGEKKAALIDGGMGTGNLPGLVDELTYLPVLPVLTHGHGDHYLGMLSYAMIYLDEADIPLIRSDYEAERKEAEAEGESLPPLPGLLPLSELTDEDRRIDLGGRHLRIIPIPGHTPGSVGFLLEEDRILFSGDGLTYNVWMQLPESSPLEDYLRTLQDLRPIAGDFDRIYTGHSQTPFEAGHLEKVIRLIQKVIDEPFGTPVEEPFPAIEATGDGCVVTYRL